MEYKKIPSSFKIGGQVINVIYPEYLEGAAGESNPMRGLCAIAERFDRQVDGRQTPTSMINTFYHELVHCILNTMGEDELNKSEKFVSCFAGFLTDAMDKAYFKEEDCDEKTDER